MTYEEKEAAVANLIKYKYENGITMAEAEKALGFNKNDYIALQKALNNEFVCTSAKLRDTFDSCWNCRKSTWQTVRSEDDGESTKTECSECGCLQ